MKINGNEIRPGMILEYKGNLWRVAKISHTQPGKGGAYTQAEMKDIVNGTKLNERFRSSESVERARLEQRPMTYLFNDGQNYTFMDPSTYDQIELSGEFLSDYSAWLQDNMEVGILFHQEKPISLELPAQVTLEITETEGVVKGQTATSSYKPAQLSNGENTMVPPFINTGDSVVISTADGSYVERA